MKLLIHLNFFIYSMLAANMLSAAPTAPKSLKDWQQLCEGAPAVCNPAPSGECDDASECGNTVPKECTDYAAQHNNLIYFYNDCFNYGCGISCQPTSTKENKRTYGENR